MSKMTRAGEYLAQTILTADYWKNAARKDPENPEALMWMENSSNHWMNAALVTAEKLLAVQEAAELVLSHCDRTPEGETRFERAVLGLQKALAEI